MPSHKSEVPQHAD